VAAACAPTAGSDVQTGRPAAAPSPAPSSSPSSVEVATSTSAPLPPIWPLTGAPLADPAAAAHPALVAKIDNSPDARPHTGLTKADVVYELRVEGITRFAAVFHATDADPVGPVRSARSSDMNLLADLNRPLLAWSGGNPGVTEQVQGAHAAGFLVDVSHQNASADYHRDDRRVAPHNLYTNTSALRAEHTPPGAGAPPVLFAYRSLGEALPASATDAPGMTIDFGQDVRADYAWDAGRGCWARYQVDERHGRGGSAFVDRDGEQVCPANVVIQLVPYGPDTVDARSPKAETVGSGEALVLTAGKAIAGRWSRDNPLVTTTLTDASGAVIELTPGRTWVELPEAGTPALVPLDAGTAGALVTGG
jgi:hypothetical protein